MNFNYMIDLIVPFLGIVGFCGIIIIQHRLIEDDIRGQRIKDELEHHFDQMNREAEYESLNYIEDKQAIIDIPNLAEDDK